MPITRRPAPESVDQVVRNSLRELYGAPTRPTFAGASPVSLTPALPLYAISAAKIADGEGFDAAYLFGWRNIVLDAEGRAGFADVEDDDERVEFAKLVHGPQVDAMIEAARLADRASGEIDAELRVLESPDMKLSALWLRGETSVFIPFEGMAIDLIGEARFRELAAARARAFYRHFRRTRAAPVDRYGNPVEPFEEEADAEAETEADDEESGGQMEF